MSKQLNCNSKSFDLKDFKSPILRSNIRQRINKLCLHLHRTDKKLNLQLLVLPGKMN